MFPNAGRFASIIERHGVTIFKAGSTFLKAVMSNPQNKVDVEQYGMDTLRVATFCAEPTSPAVQQFGMDLMCQQYINSYWATEHGPTSMGTTTIRLTQMPTRTLFHGSLEMFGWKMARTRLDDRFPE